MSERTDAASRAKFSPETNVRGEDGSQHGRQANDAQGAKFDAVRVVLPVPPYGLSKNARGHWSEKYRLYQQHKLEAVYRIHQATNFSQPCWSCPVQVQVRWFKPSKRKLDYSNAVNRLDPAMDAAQSAGLIVDDAQIRGISIDFDVDRQNPRVELTFSKDCA